MIMNSVVTFMLALAATSSAAKLYVSSYTGAITTLNLTNPRNGTYELSRISTDYHTVPNASWLQYDARHNNLFALDENIIGTNGSINSYKINPATGALKPVTRQQTLAAPVNAVLYNGANGSQLLAAAHYGHALSTWKVDPRSANFTPFEIFNFTLTKPGPDPDRQGASHPHQVLSDPSNKYLVIPDLGGDILHVFYVDPLTLQLSKRPSISVPAGSGPRHGRFLQQRRNATFYYLVTELGNTLLPYRVTYLPANGGLNFTSIAAGLQTYGPAYNSTISKSNKAAEIKISMDEKSLFISNRNATITTLVANNGTKIPSDAMARFTIGSDGVPKFAEISPAGGSFPRHFALSPCGKMAAVGLQLSGSVAVFEISPKTGALGKKVLASFEGLGNVTSVVWT